MSLLETIDKCIRFIEEYIDAEESKRENTDDNRGENYTENRFEVDIGPVLFICILYVPYIQFVSS